ncbi:aminopeptidase [candidate division TA06 bacterium DG_78]|uniref:Aminopeptidase n=1 Tax=candidate division TA06 bacterium DG_78 TaxID=1703772 RepID=A0A0S7YD69_UNCT6|nr:MAG: aminopeptidase [candidate division TA06 bacterium DG_78]
MELIKKLCNAYGPSGREHAISKLIRSEIQDYCQDVQIDRLGNLIAHRPPASEKKSAKIMFCAHMDEIGVIVTHIDKNGFLRFTRIGGVFPDSTLYQRVQFEHGVIGVIGVETKKETPKPPELNNMFIDIGARNKAEAEKMVTIGDIASFHQEFTSINKRVSAKALDDRIGCYCLIESLKKIKNNKDNLYFVFSVQEEVGLRGARTGAYAIAPQYALAVDVTDTGDTPESPRMDVAVGKGVAIKVKDSSFISNPMINDKLIAYAEKMKIPYQLEILEAGTTDAAIIQLVKEGVVSSVLSIPTRYIHSPNEVCDLDDVQCTIKLLISVAEEGIE